MIRKAHFWLLAVFCWVMFSVPVHAQAAPQADPHKVVQDVTDTLMSLTKTSGSKIKEDPTQYFTEVRSALEPVVSFSFIAKNVMASYWKAATKDQRVQFTETFTNSMVETLGKGMANFTDLKITTLPPQGDIQSQKKVEVRQEVQGPDGTSKVSYTMARNKSGEWKLVNVVLNGVNLGKSFRDQFVQAMKQNDNDIDKVIQNWAKQG